MPHRKFCISMAETDISKFVLHTDESIREISAMLEEKSHVMPKQEFKHFQQEHGFNYSPYGMLADPSAHMHGVGAIKNSMFDWMHTMVCNGTWNIEIGLLIGKTNLVPERVHAFLEKFRWPSRVSSMSGKRAFLTDNKPNPLSCAASEALSLYSVVRLYMMLEILPGASKAAHGAARCYFSLCEVLDMLMRINNGSVSPNVLQRAIVWHLNSFIDVYGEIEMHPKHHYMLHLPQMLWQHGMLIACFVHERKHKESKRHAS